MSRIEDAVDDLATILRDNAASVELWSKWRVGPLQLITGSGIQRFTMKHPEIGDIIVTIDGKRAEGVEP